jgi:O-antigen/teichoic acid export membrane protein
VKKVKLRRALAAASATLFPKAVSGTGALLKNTGYFGLSTLIDRVTSLVLTLLIANFLGVSDLGVYAGAMAFYMLVSAGAELGMVNFLTREIARDPDRTSRYIVHASVLATSCSAVVIGGSLLVVPHLGYSTKLSAAITITVFAILPATLNAIQIAVLVAYQKMKFQAYVRALSAILNLSIGIVLLYKGAGLASLLILFVATRCVLVVVYYAILNSSICKLRWEFEIRFARHLVRDLRSFAAISILAAAITQPEVLVLSLVTSTREVGLYSAALRIVEVVNEVARIFLTNVFPELSRAYESSRKRFNEIQAYASRALLSVGIPAAAALIVLANALVEFLYGSAFAPAASTLRILALGIPLLAAWSVYWRVLMARNQQSLVLRVQVLNVITRLAAASLLGWVWGRNGAAVALVVAFATLTVLYGYYVHQGREVSVFDGVRGTGRFAVAAAAMVALGFPLAERLQFWSLAPLCVVVYATALVAMVTGRHLLRDRLKPAVSSHTNT